MEQGLVLSCSSARFSTKFNSHLFRVLLLRCLRLPLYIFTLNQLLVWRVARHPWPPRSLCTGRHVRDGTCSRVLLTAFS